MALPMALLSGPTEGPTRAPVPVTVAKCRCPTSWGGRAERVQIGVFRLSTPRFTPLNAKEQQLAGQRFCVKPNEQHQQP